MKKLLAMLAIASGLIASNANADDAVIAIAQKSGCFACHSVQEKIMGPAFIDVAAKYKGDQQAISKLVKKVKEGGNGTWGSPSMPPNSPAVNDEDITKIVQWVLTLK